jgi:hypothetical protein
MSDTGDLLTGVSLLVAAESMLFSVWYPEISSKLNLSGKPLGKDNKGYIADVGVVLRSRAAILFVVSLVTTLGPAPVAVAIFFDALHYLCHAVLKIGDYDPVRGCLMLAWGWSLGVTGWALSLCIGLVKKRRELGRDKVPSNQSE